MTHPELRLRYALKETETGTVVVRPTRDTPRDAVYLCPDPACGARLVLHAGKILAAHFAHPAGCGCSPETRLHSAAKHQVAWDVVWWRKHSGMRPKIRTACDRCGLLHTRRLPADIRTATVEYTVTNGRRVDVGLIDSAGRVTMAVEVKFSNAVTTDKAADLSNLSLCWLEVEAGQVLREPGTWVATQHDLDVVPCDRPARRVTMTNVWRPLAAPPSRQHAPVQRAETWQECNGCGFACSTASTACPECGGDYGVPF